MTRLMRASALRGFAPLVDELGGDGAALLGRHRIDPCAIASDDGIVAVRAVNRALEAAATELATPDFGLLLADRQDPSVLGPLAAAIVAATTIGEAFEVGCRFVFTQSPDLSMAIEPDPLGRRDVVAVVYRNAFVESDYSPQAIELALGLVHRFGQLLCGYPLRSVLLPHEPLSPVERYVAFFGVDVRFGSADAALRVPQACLADPIPSGNRMLHDLALAHLESTFSDPGRGVTDRVRQAVADSLGSAGHTVDAVARRLLMHPRTLQRRLAAEGQTFESILDDVRRRTALKVIVETDLPLRHVAALVGLAEQATLTRAVRRWCGLTPSALRRSGRAPADV